MVSCPTHYLLPASIWIDKSIDIAENLPGRAPACGCWQDNSVALLGGTRNLFARRYGQPWAQTAQHGVVSRARVGYWLLATGIQ